MMDSVEKNVMRSDIPAGATRGAGDFMTGNTRSAYEGQAWKRLSARIEEKNYGDRR
jgi:hypothetical protein